MERKIIQSRINDIKDIIKSIKKSKKREDSVNDL